VSFISDSECRASLYAANADSGGRLKIAGLKRDIEKSFAGGGVNFKGCL